MSENLDPKRVDGQPAPDCALRHYKEIRKVVDHVLVGVVLVLSWSFFELAILPEVREYGWVYHLADYVAFVLLGGAMYWMFDPLIRLQSEAAKAIPPEILNDVKRQRVGRVCTIGVILFLCWCLMWAVLVAF